MGLRLASSEMIIVRYTDEVIVGFDNEADAIHFWDVNGGQEAL